MCSFLRTLTRTRTLELDKKFSFIATSLPVMSIFSKTVSQLTRNELRRAAGLFDLDDTGSVADLRSRISRHINENLHLMDNENYWHLFSRAQRAAWAARSRTPTPPPWNGITLPETPAPGSDSDSNSEPGDQIQPLEPPTTSLDRAARMQLLQNLPDDTLNAVIGNLFSNGEFSVNFIFHSPLFFIPAATFLPILKPSIDSPCSFGCRADRTGSIFGFRPLCCAFRPPSPFAPFMQQSFIPTAHDESLHPFTSIHAIRPQAIRVR